jgi:predicted RNA binding protein YcfA (HicA-like mRNA interferase family)
VFQRRGKHGDVYVHLDRPERIVQVPDHDSVDTGTFLRIIRDAQMTVDDFRRRT